MREQYETREDLAREQAVISEVSAKTGHTFIKNPKGYYKIDYSIVDAENNIIGMAEVKTRNHDYGAFPTLFISLNKYMEGVRFYTVAKIPFFIIVRFKNSIRIYLYNQTHNFRKCFSGRTLATRDEGDLEPMIHIPIRYFNEIGES